MKLQTTDERSVIFQSWFKELDVEMREFERLIKQKNEETVSKLENIPFKPEDDSIPLKPEDDSIPLKLEDSTINPTMSQCCNKSNNEDSTTTINLTMRILQQQFGA